MNRIFCIAVVLGAHSSLWALIDGGISLSASLKYDNNIIQLSEMYRDEFVDNKKPERYSISSLDDLVIGASVSAGSGITYVGGWKSGLTLTVSGDLYTNNGVCNKYFLKGVFYQRIPNLFWVYVRYHYAPYRYVSDFYVENSGYESMTYGEETYSMSIKRMLSKFLTLGVNGAYGQALYNKYYVRYDNKKHSIGGDVETSFKRVEFELGYTFENNQKIKRVSSNSKDSITDGSYQENTVNGRIRLQLPRFKKNSHSISTKYTLELRNYSSEINENKYHKKRVDTKNTLNLSYQITLLKRLDVDVFCTSIFRLTESGIYSKLADEKTYYQIQAGIIFSTDFKWE